MGLKVPRARVATVVVVLGVGVSAVVAFVSSVAVPWALPPTEAGDYFIVASASTLASVLLRFGVDRSIVRVLGVTRVTEGPTRAAMLARSAALWAVALAGAALLILALLVWPFLSVHVYHAPELRALRWPISAFLACEAARMLASESLRGMNRQIWATILGDAGRGSLFALVILFVAFSHHGSLAMVCGAAAACSATFLALSILATWLATQRSASDTGSALSGIRPVLASGGPFFLTTISTVAINQGDVLIGGALLDRPELAHYAAASKLALVIGLPISAANRVIAPRVPGLWAQGRLDALQSMVRRFAALFALIALPACAVMIAWPGPLLRLLFPDSYADAAPVLAILTAGSVVLLVSGSNGYVLLMTNGRRFVAVVAMVGAVLQVIAMILFAKLGGVVGLAVASTAGTAGINVVYGWRVTRHTGIRTDIGLTPWRLLSQPTPPD